MTPETEARRTDSWVVDAVEKCEAMALWCAGEPEEGEWLNRATAIRALRARVAELEAESERPKIEFHPIDMISKSDCFLACISSLTGIPILDLPQPPTTFEQLVTLGGEPSDDDYNAEVQYARAVVEHLRLHGWKLVNVERFVPAGYAIATGPSLRNPKIDHSVVYLNGRLHHDPHPSRAGLRSVALYEILVPAALRPAEGGET